MPREKVKRVLISGSPKFWENTDAQQRLQGFDSRASFIRYAVEQVSIKQDKIPKVDFL